MRASVLIIHCPSFVSRTITAELIERIIGAISTFFWSFCFVFDLCLTNGTNLRHDRPSRVPTPGGPGLPVFRRPGRRRVRREIDMTGSLPRRRTITAPTSWAIIARRLLFKFMLTHMIMIFGRRLLKPTVTATRTRDTVTVTAWQGDPGPGPADSGAVGITADSKLSGRGRRHGSTGTITVLSRSPSPGHPTPFTVTVVTGCGGPARYRGQ